MANYQQNDLNHLPGHPPVVAQEQHCDNLYLTPVKEFPGKSRLYRNPHVCFNNNGVVVVFYGKYKRLYYQIGKYNHDITWGNEYFYHDGFFPQAALGDNGVLVVVRSHVIRRRCSCRVGYVNEEALTVEWGEEFNRGLGSGAGMNPSVALIEKPEVADSAVILFYTTSEFAKYRSFYSVGKFNNTTTKLSSIGPTERHVAELDNCKNISVAANKEGTVLLLFQSSTSLRHTLSYAVGKFEDNVINNLMPFTFTIGYFPRVNLLSNGMAIETHEAVGSSSLVFKYAQVEGDGKIQWSKGQKCESGYTPSLACNDHLKLVDVHTSYFGGLRYRTGLFT